MTTSRSSSQFYKIILPSTIEERKLRIPEKFVREFGDELSTTVATLTLPYGGIWKVGLEKADEKIWFNDGWQEFIEYHSISSGHLLVFGYEGNSNFHVLIFDPTATEVQYPSSKNCKLENQVIIVENELEATGRNGAIQAAREFRPECPSFMAILQPYNIVRNYLYVPAGYAKNYIGSDQTVKLQTSDKKHWSVQCNYYHYGAYKVMRMGNGWSAFSKGNNLREGDVCVFEVIQRMLIVLGISIFHIADHAVN